MDGMGDDDRAGDDTPDDFRHDVAGDNPTNERGRTDSPESDAERTGDIGDPTDGVRSAEPHWDDLDDDDLLDDDWDDDDMHGCTAAMAEILHPSACLVPAGPTGGGCGSGRSPIGAADRPRRTTPDTSTAIVPILCAVAGVFVMVAIVQLIPGEWPFWRGSASVAAGQMPTSTLQPHPATFSLLEGGESRTAVLASPAGLLATISRLKPAQSVTVAHQLWVDTATLVAWDRRSGVAVYEISSTHPMPTIATTLPPGDFVSTAINEHFDAVEDEIQVSCDGTCPADPGAPVQQNGTLVGLVALDAADHDGQHEPEDDKVITIPLDRLQEIADELVNASGG